MQPESPVSVPPWDPPAKQSNVKPYGKQRRANWGPPAAGHAADTKEKQVVDLAEPAPFLYRVSIFGAGILLRIVYGSQQTRATFDNIRTPFVGTFPGVVAIYARPLVTPVESSLQCEPTVTMASGGRSEMRALIDATGGALAFHPDAVRFVALAASTATIAGVTPVAIPVLGSVPLVAGATLLTGVGFQEFEP